MRGGGRGEVVRWLVVAPGEESMVCWLEGGVLVGMNGLMRVLRVCRMHVGYGNGTRRSVKICEVRRCGM